MRYLSRSLIRQGYTIAAKIHKPLWTFAELARALNVEHKQTPRRRLLEDALEVEGVSIDSRSCMQGIFCRACR